MNMVRKILAWVLFAVAIFIAGYTVFVHDSRFITGLLLVCAVLILILAFVLWIQSKMKPPKEKSVKPAAENTPQETIPQPNEELSSTEQAEQINLQQEEAKETVQQNTESEEK